MLTLEFKRRPGDDWERHTDTVKTHLEAMLLGLAVCQRWPGALFRIRDVAPPYRPGGLSNAAIASTNGNDSATIQK